MAGRAMGNGAGVVLVIGAAAVGGYFLWEQQRREEQRFRQQQLAVQWAATNPPQQRQSKAQKWGPLLNWGLSEIVNSRNGNGGGLLSGIFGNKGKPRGSGPVSSGRGVANGNTGQRLMADLQRDFGLTREQAAGITGNLDHESGGFKSLQEINPTVRGSRGGYGYAQWTGPRRREFESWAAQRGLNTSSYDANYGFLKHELSGSEKRVMPRLRRAKTADEAATIFSGKYGGSNAYDGFLRPGVWHINSRKSRARKWAKV